MSDPDQPADWPTSSRRDVLYSMAGLGGGFSLNDFWRAARVGSRRRTTMGVYASAAQIGIANMPGFERWLGRPVRYVIDNGDQSRGWAQVVSSLDWMGRQWAATRWIPYVGVPMLPQDEHGKLSEGADGQFDVHFARVASNLVRQGLGRADIRIGWEMNGDWQPWSARRDPEAWRRFYRRAVAAMRSAPGQAFRFDWCVALGDMGMDPALAYPGNAHVDIVGGDIYCESAPWLPANPARKFADHYRDGRYGLAWHRAFAARHRKRMSFPEWGTSAGSLGAQRYGGGDDPAFIHGMARWMDGLGRRLTRHHYFLKATDRDCDLTNADRFPRAGAAFRQEFGDPMKAA